MSRHDRFCFLVAGILVIAVGAVSPARANLLTNGDFEAAPYDTGWTRSNVNIGTAETTSPISGSTSLRMSWNNQGYTGNVDQSLASVLSDFDYSFTFRQLGNTAGRSMNTLLLAGGAGVNARVLVQGTAGVDDDTLQVYDGSGWQNVSAVGAFSGISQDYRISIRGRDWGTPAASYDLLWSDAGSTLLTHQATGLTHFQSSGPTTSKLETVRFAKPESTGNTWMVDNVVLTAPASAFAPAVAEPVATGTGAYTTGTSVGGQNPPVTGFVDAWDSPGTGAFRPQGAGLDYYTPDGRQRLTTSGGAIHADVPNTANREVARALDYDVSGLGNDTIYVSGLIRFPDPGAANNGGFAMIKLVDTDGSGLNNEDFGIQFGVNQGDIRIRARQSSTIVGKDFTVQEGYVPGQDYLFVIKSEINAVGGWQDRTSVWLSPADLSSEAAAGTPQISNLLLGNVNQVGTQAWDHLRLRTVNFNAGGSVIFDEIRMGATWESVVPSQAVTPQGTRAYEPFDYGQNQNVNPGPLNGGSGWGGPWVPLANTGTFQTQLPPDGEMRFSGPGVDFNGGERAIRVRGFGGADSRSITRNLASPISDPEVWMSFLLRWDAAASAADGDFVSVGFGPDLAMGVKADEGGGGSRDFFVRMDGGLEDYAGELVEGSDYFLVGRLRKSDPSGEYDSFDLWINPGVIDLNRPDATSFGLSGLSDLSMLEIRQAFLENNEYVWLDEIRIGATFFDVAPVPEPLTLALLGLAGTGLGGYLRRRR
ncbi:MAG TPA: PEP-CTERM sorting domain-containing protein [Phycisphaerae bacterium]|nr:PEP-CTERM sorting domain-containing protein [Phycisphaerae bacterium]HQL74955.1 PEP-CTERM sorting domain-containing protein [Phycisphaerae bacterium]